MKEPISEELLSAYVDGELSADERATIEHWLEQSPEARAKLGDFRRLSAVFAELPRTEVPQEFPVEVLQLAERRMLLPEVAAVSPNRSLHRWGVAIGVSVASAAGLLLILQATIREPNLPPNAVAFRENAALAPPADQEGIAPTERNSDLRREVSQRGPLSKSETGPEAQVLAHSDPVKRDGAKADSPAPSGPALAGIGKKVDPSANPQLAKVKLAIEAVSNSDAEDEMVSVVKVYVIDQAYGMRLMQDYFSNNGVPLEGRADSGVGKGDSDSANRGAATIRKSANPREALYVEGESNQVLAAIANMEADMAGMRVEVEAPIEMAALDPASQNRLKRATVDAPRLRDRGRGASQPTSAPVAAAAGVAGGAKPSADAAPRAKKASPGNKPVAETADQKADKQSDEKQNATQAAPRNNPAGAPAEQKSRVPQSENAANMARGTVNGAANAQVSQAFRQVVMPVPLAVEQRKQLGEAKAQVNNPTDSPTDGKGQARILRRRVAPRSVPRRRTIAIKTPLRRTQSRCRDRRQSCAS